MSPILLAMLIWCSEHVGACSRIQDSIVICGATLPTLDPKREAVLPAGEVSIILLPECVRV